MMKPESTTELIEDHEIRSRGEDRLNHTAFATNLADLACSVPTPANIALYGPWGSGKSSVSGLLKQEIESREACKFIRFDAFKYAENPLRRNFLSAVAEELGLSETEVTAELYSGSSRTVVRLPTGRGWGPPMRVFLTLLGAFLAALALVSGLLAFVTLWASDFAEGFWTRWASYMMATAGSAVLSSAVLAATLALIGRSLTVDRRADPPQSDEQFEKIFRQVLSGQKGVDRFVVFVDELDRCSPDEVVGTLSAIRTFLGVDKCVFIVAADQQVLEAALNRAIGQATPVDDVNPYYTAGSAYLDKVFQYQVSLPPLFPETITRYALDLVEGRPGVWALPQASDIVSTLVPSHVQSPRRVKHLLNAYVLAARTVQSRQVEGLLTDAFPKKAAQLARWTCLQVEFPSFARDLSLEPALPSMTLAVARWRSEQEALALDAAEPGADAVALETDDEVPDDFWQTRGWSRVSQRARDLAIAYADGHRRPLPMLEPRSSRGTDSDRMPAAVAQSSRQLLNYLRRTEQVGGPDADLVFLKSLASTYGLDVTAAEAIRRAALDGDISEVVEFCSGDQPAGPVLDLLADLLRSSVGLETTNVIRSVAAAAGTFSDLPSRQASRVGSQLARSGETFPSVGDGEDAPAKAASGLLALAKAAGASEVAEVLTRMLIADVQFHLTDAVWVLLCDHACVVASPKAAGEAFATWLFEVDLGEEHELLAPLDDETAAALLKAARIPLAATLRPVASGDGITPDPAVLISNLALLARTRGVASGVAGPALRILAIVDTIEARSAVEATLPVLDQLADPQLAALLLNQALAVRHISNWSLWLDAMAPAVLGDRRVQAALTTQIPTLWKRASDEKVDLAKVGPSLTRFAIAIQEGPDTPDLAPLTAAAEAALRATPPNDTGALVVEHTRLLAVARGLAESGLLTVEELVRVELELVTPVLATGWAMQGTDFPPSVLVEAVCSLIADAESPLPMATQEALVDQLSRCTWLAPACRLSAEIHLVNSAAFDAVDPSDLLQDLRALAASAPGDPESQALAARWVEAVRPTGRGLAEALEGFWAPGVPPSDALIRALHGWSRAANPDDRNDAISRLLDSTQTAVLPDPSVWIPLALPEYPRELLLTDLVARMDSAGSAGECRAILDVWRESQYRKLDDRKQLAERVLLPALQSGHLGAEAKRAIVDALPDMLKPVPQPVQVGIRDALNAVAEQHSELEDVVDDAFDRLKIKRKEKRGPFGLG